MALIVSYSFLPGVSHQCYWYIYHGSGVPEVCRNGEDSCVSNFTRSNLDDMIIQTERWGCTSDCTPGDYSFTTLEDLYFRRRIHCCQGDYCNNQSTPESDPPYNGLVCPGCISSSFEDCQDSETVRCRGEENLCIEFVMAYYGFRRSDVAFKGCATRDFCRMARTSVTYDYIFDKINQAQCCHTAQPPTLKSKEVQP
ncbi:phospholipase A2 inhibitor and Ly6/PLAUR domain-containing protein-like [Podarcis muralis]